MGPHMTPKVCSKCSVELVAGENWSEGSIKSRTRVCRTCNSAKGKLWSKVNRERAREVAKARRHANPELMRARKAEYYQRNKEKWREYHRNWRDANRLTPDRRAQIILTFTQTRAKRRGLECDLTREFIAERLTRGRCEATGFPLVLEDAARGLKKIHPHAPSIDRIDPRKGYTQDNCRVVAYIYNVAKADYTDSDVLELARALVAQADKA